MKPILFNTEMTRAILDGRKTVTRRVVRGANHLWCFDGMELNPAMTKFRKNGEEYPVDMPGLWAIFESEGPIEYPMIKAPYQPGDILYVRETWTTLIGQYIYKADQKPGMNNPGRWRPSIHMPSEAARIFLRVTDVRVELLQNIFAEITGTNSQVVQEGFVYGGDFITCWDRTIKPADRAIYGWNANPWCWVIEFERISREEAENGLPRAD